MANAGEYGIVFNFGCGFDLSAKTGLTLTITRPDGTVLTIATGRLTISASPLVTPLGTFAANTYAICTFANGDINQAGDYSARLTYDASGPVHLISDAAVFTVGE